MSLARMVALTGLMRHFFSKEPVFVFLAHQAVDHKVCVIYLIYVT